jgi:hypothetical protein
VGLFEALAPAADAKAEGAAQVNAAVLQPAVEATEVFEPIVGVKGKGQGQGQEQEQEQEQEQGQGQGQAVEVTA